MIQLTRIQPPGQTQLSISIPLVYDIQSNQTSVTPKVTKTEVGRQADIHLRAFSESGRVPQGRCTLGPAVHDLLFTFNPFGPPKGGTYFTTVCPKLFGLLTSSQNGSKELVETSIMPSDT